MSRFFISRPIFATVIALIMLLAGVATMFTLPIAQFPTIVPPTVQVSAVYNGADAETVANAVTSPLEQQINGVQGMLYMSSNSTSTGQSIITCTFEVGYDLNIAAVDVQNRAQQAFSQLPPEVQQLGITVTKQSSNMTIVAALRSPDGAYDSRYLTNLADITVAPALQRLPGVGAVTIFGLEQYSMRVWLDPAKLAAMGLTSSDVMKAVQSQNKQSAIGSIGAEPSSDKPAFVFSLTTQGRLVTEDEFNDIVVRTGDSGAVVRIRDIGRAEMGSYLYSSTSHYNGNGAALIGVYQLPDANAFEVAQGVREELERLSPMLPPGVTHEVAYDTTLFVQASLDELIKTLVEAAVLVLIVIFVFLQDWRATLIPMVAIPVSIVGTFAVMAAFGFSINSLTLLGLVLAIGLVVDDAIIVVENVYHQVEHGEKDMREAAVKAMAQVTGPIVATSLVLLAVFIPAALMPGMTGQLYNQFALTIAFSIVLSAVNSLTLSPALSAVFLKPGQGPTTFAPFVLFNRFFDWLREKYGTVIHWFGVHWYIVAGVFVAAVATIAVMLVRTPTAFIPNEDQGYYFIGVQLPPGASLPRTVAVSEAARRIAAADESVVNVLQIEGFNFLTGTSQTNSAFLIVTLKPWEERDPRTQNARRMMARAAAAARDPRGERVPRAAAADRRPRRRGRLAAAAPGRAGRRLRAVRRGRARIRRGRAQAARAVGAQLAVQRRGAGGAARGRPDQDAAARRLDRRRLRGARPEPRPGVREQLHAVRAGLQRDDPGRGRAAHGRRGHPQHPRAQRAGRHGAAVRGREALARHRHRQRDPLQPLQHRAGPVSYTHLTLPTNREV